MSSIHRDENYNAISFSRVGQIMPFFAKLEVNECFLWPNCPLNTNMETKMCCDDVL